MGVGKPKGPGGGRSGGGATRKICRQEQNEDGALCRLGERAMQCAELMALKGLQKLAVPRMGDSPKMTDGSG
jgi:hypothetical protein